ncbi:MAG: site-specific integrase [Alphaproteobacteria bacterium]|jgi:integrase|nr:site-specific integrase [Alphaproteobacteria bacterium]
MRLTNKSIKAFAYQGGWDVRWDDTVPGLGVRIYPTGKKSFVLSYRAAGRKRLMVLGRYGADLTLDQARDKARKLRVKVREGEDPAEAKRREAQGQTFGDLIGAYIERHAKVHKRTWPADERRLRLHIPQTWLGRKANAIKREEVADLHNRFGLRAPYEANRLLEVLRKMFKLAKVWGFVDETDVNPAEGIQRFKERKRKRWVEPEELPRLVDAIDQEPNVYIRAAIWLFILSGVRRSELLEAKWEQVLWNRGQLRLPETKSGEEQHATLSGPALAILQGIPKQEGNPYIFPGAKQGHHLVNITKPWGRIRKAADVDDLRLHDLRRTVGSWMTQAGVDLNLIRDALRHQNISTTLTYARLGQDAAREAFEDHGRRILEAAGRRGPLAVVEGGAKDE